ncbi:hypothetical protein KCP70_25590 [Salmonella enterica subsp. enterica]|nr:hypothetical protein KCP70_25590 [Salmonella enterica subsp. enterica]
MPEIAKLCDSGLPKQGTDAAMALAMATSCCASSTDNSAPVLHRLCPSLAYRHANAGDA